MTTSESGASIKHTESRGISPAVKVGVVFVMLAGALLLLVFGSQASDAFVYSKLVHEVVTDPGAFEGRELRVEGDLVKGSIEFRENSGDGAAGQRVCEYRFVLEKEGETMPVSFPECIVPDTFRDGMDLEVTVQGRLQPDGSFVANQVIPRCPSKYEMKQKAASGEQAPHAMPAEQGLIEGDY